MSNAYISLSRQDGLLKELQVLSNNIANANTVGFRQSGVVFSEYVNSQGSEAPISMTASRIGSLSLLQGGLTNTGGELDLAIEGDGFFRVETDRGERLTRAGNFSKNSDGEVVNAMGHRVLDVAGAPIFVPPDASGISISADGDISADGNLLGRISVVSPEDITSLKQEASTMFAFRGDVVESETSSVRQGFVEDSNVNSILQIARLVEVQRAYEMGQSFLETENNRLRNAIETLVRR